MNISKQETLLRIALGFLIAKIEDKGQNLALVPEGEYYLEDFCLGEVHDLLVDTLDVFAPVNDNEDDIDLRKIAVAWMESYEMWCDARLATPPESDV